jgi:transposase
MNIRLPKKIFFATAPVNLRLSFDRLAGIVRTELGGDPREESVFVFHNRRRTHLKILWHDRSGYCLFYKRLDRNRYRIPIAVPAHTASVIVTERELRVILEGIDMSLVRSARRRERAAAA